MKKRILIKSIILIVVISIYNIFIQSISPVFTNELAMNQMQNSVDSSSGLQIYTYVSNYGWIIILILAIAIFYKDVKEIIKKTKEKFYEEN